MRAVRRRRDAARRAGAAGPRRRADVTGRAGHGHDAVHRPATGARRSACGRRWPAPESALGVILGGVLTSEAGWRWVFSINVPIGAALLIAIPLAVPAAPPPAPRTRDLDLPGAVLVTAGTGAAIYGLINVGSHGWSAASTVLPLVLAAAIWTAFALLERRVRPSRCSPSACSAADRCWLAAS